MKVYFKKKTYNSFFQNKGQTFFLCFELFATVMELHFKTQSGARVKCQSEDGEIKITLASLQVMN